MNSYISQAQAALNRFLARDDGAVTVDWVVMTAAVVGMTIMLFSILTPAVFEDAANVIRDMIVSAYARP